MKAKQHQPQHLKICLLGAAGYLLLPCLYAQAAFTTWFPYHLSGKQFLSWYIAHALTGYLLLLLISICRPDARNKLPRVLIVLTTILTIGRIAQGIYHQKPVLYLCLLTALNVFLLLISDKSAGKQ